MLNNIYNTLRVYGRWKF